MSFDGKSLMRLLPAVHRIRDAEIAAGKGLERGPLQTLMSVIAEQITIVEESLEQGYDDLFVETCNDWVVPYIGDLIGYESLHGSVPEIASPRAEVARTIALRRRKGTIVVLEQLARDVTGWDARAVEYFQTLGWTQHTNHLRLFRFYAPDLRKQVELERIGTPFNKASFTTEVRRVASRRGRHNIPNIGIHLWRLDAYQHTRVPAIRVGDRRYFISPLSSNINLFSRPRLRAAFIDKLSEPVNVPEPLSRRQLHHHFADYYGFRQSAGDDVDNAEPSIVLYINGDEIPRDQVVVCNLSDFAGAWAHQPDDGEYGIDPVLGRVALPADAADPALVKVTYHRGFSADIGGGEYDRQDGFSDPGELPVIEVPGPQGDTIQAAIDALAGAGIVEVTDNNRYEEAITVNVSANAGIELRAAKERNPTLILTAPMQISGEENSRFTINGFCISGNTIVVNDTGSNELRELTVAHCTLVPELTLDNEGVPQSPGQTSLLVETGDVMVTLHRTISGPLRIPPESRLNMTDSIIDANDASAIALAAPDAPGSPDDPDASDPEAAGAVTNINACTVIGKLHVREFELVTDSILLARLAVKDSWNAAVWAERKQSGCIRYSFLPFTSIVPRRFRCQPNSLDNARRIAPRFTSLTFLQPAYCQLAAITAEEIRRGAEDESEMGAFHHLYAPQREINLTIRLREYLRVGMQAGIFLQT